LTLLLADVYYIKSIHPPGEHGRAYLRAQQNRTAVRPSTDTDVSVPLANGSALAIRDTNCTARSLTRC